MIGRSERGRRPGPLARVVRLGSWLALALAVPTGCGRTAPDQNSLVVFAAASLTDGLSEMAERFEAANPEIDVSIAFAGSQVLRLQIEQGAPADVFASANQRHMEALVTAGKVRASQLFAHNQLVVIVPLDNPAGIESLSDLPRARRLVIGNPTVPVGSYTRQMLERAGQQLGPAFLSEVRARVVSEENNVRLVRAKVELGEADAAIVYRTDAMATDRVRSIAIPEAFDVRAEYTIGQVSAAAHPELARRWIDYVLSDLGREVLAEHGFVTAP